MLYIHHMYTFVLPGPSWKNETHNNVATTDT